VTRQAAWERWRDLDDELVHRSAFRSVPSVVGLDLESAGRVLTSAGLIPLPPPSPGILGHVVTDQVPRGGERIEVGSPITLYIEPRRAEAAE
jgi:beta-lactam-binding protein with PASTA domain